MFAPCTLFHLGENRITRGNQSVKISFDGSIDDGRFFDTVCHGSPRLFALRTCRALQGYSDIVGEKRAVWTPWRSYLAHSASDPPNSRALDAATDKSHTGVADPQ